MFYYYMVRLADKYDALDGEVVREYIDKKKFKSFDDDNIRKLAAKHRKSPSETLRSVFSDYIKIEHLLAKVLLKPSDYFVNGFEEEYYDSIKDYEIKKSDKDKFKILSAVHREDSEFMEKKKDGFLTSLSFLSKMRESQDSDYSDSEQETDSEEEYESKSKEKYYQVLILLDENKEYLGHIYVWSWLAAAREYKNLFTLKFAGIRTSVRNLINREVRNISTIFINIIATWAKNHGYEYIEVGLDPMGPMYNSLKICGFNKGIININNVKCHTEKNFAQLLPVTDLFNLKNQYDLEEWYDRRKAKDEKLIRNMWFGYDIASDMYKIYKMSYPDRTPKSYELEHIYHLTFINKHGYLPNGEHSYLDDNKSSVIVVQEKINELKQIDSDLSDYLENNMLRTIIPLFNLKIRFIKFTSWYEKAVYDGGLRYEIENRRKDLTNLVRHVKSNFYDIIIDNSYGNKLDDFHNTGTNIRNNISSMMLLE